MLPRAKWQRRNFEIRRPPFVTWRRAELLASSASGYGIERVDVPIVVAYVDQVLCSEAVAAAGVGGGF